MAEIKYKKFLNHFWDPYKISERSLLPISKMLWHFAIGSTVWVLELCEVARILF